MIDYPLIWAGLIAFAVLAYIILDGFDLGIGILFPLIKEEKDKEIALNSIAPIWDGNETWLVLGGGGLYAVFPLAYSIILPALYMPIILMLLGLVFRGVAFEFIFRSKSNKHLWQLGFTLGSIIAALVQGIALGALVQGILVDDRAYAGGWWDWLTPFSITTGIALVIGYALLGSTWLIMKTEGELQTLAKKVANVSGVITFLMIGLISLWMVLTQQHYLQRWLTIPNIYYFMLVPGLVAIVGVNLFRTLKEGREVAPFLLAISLFILSYVGLCISFFPNIVPPSVSLWTAAAPDNSLKFLLFGTAFLLPIIIAYTSYSYWVFRGKVNPDDAYH